MREIKTGDKYLCNIGNYAEGYFTKGNIYDVKIVDKDGVSFITDGEFGFKIEYFFLKNDFIDLQESKSEIESLIKEYGIKPDILNEIATPKNDAIVSSVMFQLAQRSILGQQKYGTTLQENNNDDFLQHLKEELMDAILYIEKLQSIK